MRVALLGPLELQPVGPVLGPRDRVVLGALALRRGRTVSAEGLADALWRDVPPSTWPKVVQGCVSRLRRALGSEVIDTNPSGYLLRPDRVQVDVDEFEDLVARAREHVREGLPERAAALLDQALAMWRGTPLPDLEEWGPGRLEAARLVELHLEAQEERLAARLASGHHVEVAGEGTILVGEQPWRERRWVTLALAQYRCGRQADALASIRTARRALGRDLGLDPGSDLVSLERAILEQKPSLAAEHDARLVSSRCPWRGLAAYEAEHRDTFFGRSAEIEACLARLEHNPLLVLTGPSGSGKSSLMRAGLVPGLRQRSHAVVVASTGSDPVATVTAALAGAEGWPVLCLDQLEEVFARRDTSDAARSLLQLLAQYATDRAPVIVTIRADHLPALAMHRGFADLAQNGLTIVSPLEGEALREAIEGPARSAGLRLEHGLVDLLLREAEHQAGALPLLCHALTETWQRRDGALLTVDGYRASGGIAGAVAASADRLCDDLPQPALAQLRWLMLRMVALGDHGEPVLEALSADVVTDHPERARVLDLLVRARLVTSGDAGFEVAHEALTRAWPRLQAWLAEDRDGRRVWRHVATTAIEWTALGRPDSELYQGVRLEAALEWAARPESQPTQAERDFLEESSRRADAERRALTERATSQRRQNHRLRRLLTGLVALLLVAVVASVAAVNRGRTAAAERDDAEAARRAAQHESLVGRSLDLRSTNRSASAVLAVEAWRREPDALATSALLGAFTDAPGLLGYSYLPGVSSLDAAPIGRTQRAVVAGGSGHLGVLAITTGRITHPFGPPLPGALDYSVVRVSADGERVAQLVSAAPDPDRCGTYRSLRLDDGRGCSILVVHDVATGRRLLGPQVLPFSAAGVAISADGMLVAVAGGMNGDLVTYAVSTGRSHGRLAGLSRPRGVRLWRNTAAVAFDSGDHVYLGSMAGPVREVDARTMRVVRTFQAPPMSSHNDVVPTRSGFLVVAGDRARVAFDERSGRLLWTTSLVHESSSEPCPFFAVADPGGRFFCGTYFGEVEEFDLGTGQQTGVRLDPQLGSVGDLIVTGDPAHAPSPSDYVPELVAFTGGGAGVYSRWQVGGSGLAARRLSADGGSPIGYDPSGRYVLVEGDTSLGQSEPFLPYVVDVKSGEDYRAPPPGSHLAWAGPGILAYWGAGGGGLWDFSSGTRLPVPLLDDATEQVYAETGGRFAWATRGDGDSMSARRFEVSDGDASTLLEVPGSVGSIAAVPGEDPAVLVTFEGAGGWRSVVFDAEGGHRLASGLEGQVRVAVSSTGRVVGADAAGVISEFDPVDLAAVASLPGSRGSPSSLQFDDAGELLVVTTGNQSVQVYDVATRTRIGDLAAAAREGMVEGWLRPDGRAVLLNSAFGVAEWSIEADFLSGAACELAGRNLTPTEWSTYFGSEPYRATCPGFPPGA